MNDLTALEKKLNRDELDYLDDLITVVGPSRRPLLSLICCCVYLRPTLLYLLTLLLLMFDQPQVEASTEPKWKERSSKPGERPFLDQARKTLESIDGGLLSQTNVERIRTLCVPVNFNGKAIAVLSRDFSPDDQRVAGELEMTYFPFRKWASVISQGNIHLKLQEKPNLHQE